MDTVVWNNILMTQFCIFCRVRGSECVWYEELVWQTEIMTVRQKWRPQCWASDTARLCHDYYQRIASFKSVLILLKGSYSTNIIIISRGSSGNKNNFLLLLLIKVTSIVTVIIVLFIILKLYNIIVIIIYIIVLIIIPLLLLC